MTPPQVLDWNAFWRNPVITGAGLTPGVNNSTVLGTATNQWSDLRAVTATFTGPVSFNGGFNGALTGNASTATALATPRTINGVSFDGTANITVTAAAGTLTGSALAGTVTSSSLTSLGTIAALSAGSGSFTGALSALTLTSSGNITIGAGGGDVQWLNNAGYGLLSTNGTRVLAVTNAGVGIPNITGATSVAGAIAGGAGATFNGQVATTVTGGVIGFAVSAGTGQGYMRIASSVTNGEVAYRVSDGTNEWYAGLMGDVTSADGSYVLYRSGVQAKLSTAGALTLTGGLAATTGTFSGLLTGNAGATITGGNIALCGTALTVNNATGAVAMGFTLGVTGTSTLGIVNASGLVSANLGLTVSGNATTNAQQLKIINTAASGGTWTIGEVNGAGSLAFRLIDSITNPTILTLTVAGASVNGTLAATGGFGCNTKSAQTAFASGGAAPAGGTGATAGAYDTAAHRDAAITLLNNIRSALVANGIMS